MGKLPFPHYPGSSEAAADAGGRSKDQQATFSALQGNLSGQEDKASNQASGDIEGSVASAADAPQNGAGEAGAAALVGGGAVDHFAKAIETYNGHVDRLNEEYETAKADDFGVAADAGHEEGNTDAQNDAARDDKVEAADTALQDKLEKERQQKEDDLDDAADFSASMLIAGPTESTMLSLYLTGSIDGEAVADALGIGIATLNNMRMAAGSIKTLQGAPRALSALTKYLLRMDPKTLAPGTMDAVKKDLRKVVQRNLKNPNMTFQQRIDAYKSAKRVSIRGQNLVKWSTPGNLFGKWGDKAGYVGRHAAKASRMGPLISKTGSFLGKKALPPAAVAAGVHGLVDTYQNRENTTTEKEVNRYIGSGATVVSGALGTGLAAAAATGAVFPPAGAAIAVGAGVVALGSMAIDHFDLEDDIADFAEGAADKVSDGIGAIGDALGF